MNKWAFKSYPADGQADSQNSKIMSAQKSRITGRSGNPLAWLAMMVTTLTCFYSPRR